MEGDPPHVTKDVQLEATFHQPQSRQREPVREP